MPKWALQTRCPAASENSVDRCPVHGQSRLYWVTLMTRMSSPQPSPLHEKLSAILTISQQMNSERDLGALLDLVAREATRLLDADRASIFLLDRGTMVLWSKVALGSDEILRFDARKGIAGAAALTGKVINVSDAYNDSRFNSTIDTQTG